MEVLNGKIKELDTTADRASCDAFAGATCDQSETCPAGVLEAYFGRLADRGSSTGFWSFAATRAEVVSRSRWNSTNEFEPCFGEILVVHRA